MSDDAVIQRVFKYDEWGLEFPIMGGFDERVYYIADVLEGFYAGREELQCV